MPLLIALIASCRSGVWSIAPSIASSTTAGSPSPTSSVAAIVARPTMNSPWPSVFAASATALRISTSAPATSRRTSSRRTFSVGASSRKTKNRSIRNLAPAASVAPPARSAVTRSVNIVFASSSRSSGKSLNAQPAKCAPHPGPVAARRSSSSRANVSIPSTSGWIRLSGWIRPSASSRPAGRAANQRVASSNCRCGRSCPAGNAIVPPGGVLEPRSSIADGSMFRPPSYRAWIGPPGGMPPSSASQRTETSPVGIGTSPPVSVVNVDAFTRSRKPAAGRPA